MIWQKFCRIIKFKNREEIVCLRILQRVTKREKERFNIFYPNAVEVTDGNLIP